MNILLLKHSQIFFPVRGKIGELKRKVLTLQNKPITEGLDDNNIENMILVMSRKK